jgi:tetratricopeptide (TPR) repeat protein
MRFRPHVLHYIGHGAYDEQVGGVLLWEDDAGKEFPITASRLADLLRRRGLHAVVMHACQTARRDARTDTLGVAGTLVMAGIPAVLAQQANLSYQSSQLASKTWYQALTAGYSCAEALFEVRQALSQDEHPDWAVPVLYGSAASLAPLLDPAAPAGNPDSQLSSQSRALSLPTPTGVFVGRHRELRELHLMLEHSPGRGPVLALITGPGGVGKSTLAAQTVTRYSARYKAALTLPCAGYQDFTLSVLKPIAEFLKSQGVAGLLDAILPDPTLSTAAKMDQAIAALNSAGPFLLIVDNLESVQNEDHTLRDGDLLLFLQKLLANLRGSRVLITGRYAVQGLLPDGKFAAHVLHLDLDDLSPYETDRLIAHHPSLAQLGEQVRQTLIREFGGLPYVYDLLSSEAASQNLDLLLHDIQGRITSERQQRSAEEWNTIRQRVIEFAALAAAVARLSASSRTLLGRLSVLRRPFPLDALVQGLSASRPDWQALLDWSLLRYDPTESTYRLHSLTRRYAQDHLLAEPERVQTQAELAAWYQHYARHDSHDLADSLEAHRLYRASGDVQHAAELALWLADWLRRSGQYSVLRELCTMTVQDMHERDESLMAGALDELGNLAYLQGDYAEAQRRYQQSLAFFEQLGDLAGQASSWHQLGMLAQQQRDYAEARRLYQQSLQIQEQLGNLAGQALSWHQLGNLAFLQGNDAEARRLYQQSLQLREQLGDLVGQASSWHGLPTGCATSW